MAAKFDSTSTTDDVLAGVRVDGKRILVTGVSAGIGAETARALAARGAHVVGAVRDLEKAHRVTTGVSEAASAGAGDGNRTHVSSLGSCSSTIELHPPRWTPSRTYAPRRGIVHALVGLDNYRPLYP